MSAELAPLPAGNSSARIAELVHRAWRRSRTAVPQRQHVVPRAVWTEAEAARRLESDPHGRLLVWMIDRLLQTAAREHSLAVVVADATGRLLRVSGAEGFAGHAENTGALQWLRAGVDWSEPVMGTNAIGTAALTGEPVWVRGVQHYAPSAQIMESWAVPVRCPKSADVHSIIGLCAPHAAHPQALGARSGFELPLLSATASAVEARLAHRDLVSATHTDGQLAVLSRREAVLTSDYSQMVLSARHSEIALLLAWHRQGISADRLGRMLYDDVPRAAVVRAEMRRLRDFLDRGIGPALTSRPYAFVEAPQLDLTDVLERLQRSDVAGALVRYRAPVLPESTAPGVIAIREEVHCAVRREVLQQASPALLLDFARRPENAYDGELWWQVAGQFPPGSPEHDQALIQCQRIEEELAV